MNLDAVQRFEIAEVEQDYTAKDTLLFALSLGWGDDPLDARQLRLVYEKDQQVLPAYANVLGHPGFWLRTPELGIDWVRIVYFGHRFDIVSPLPPAARVVVAHRILGVEDRGADRGAMISLEKTIRCSTTGTLFATTTAAMLLRGDGGQGGFGEVILPPGPPRDFAAECAAQIHVSPRTALLYRLNGDMNPLHADPEVAKAAGFDRPILHGLGTMGLIERALLETVGNHDVAAVRSMSVRFRSVVFPGDMLRVEFGRTGDEMAFRCLVPARQAVVADGIARIGRAAT